MARESCRRNPRNRSPDRSYFAVRSGEIKASEKQVGETASGGDEDARVMKRLRFAEGADYSLEQESSGKAKMNAVSGVDGPKTSEYAFFRKLRQEVGKTGLPVRKKSDKTDERQSGDSSGVGNIVRHCFQNLKSSLPLQAEDVRHPEFSLHLTPIAGPSKATEMNYLEHPDFRSQEFLHPIKATPVNFEISSSPFRDSVRSAVANYVYGQGNVFSTKRDELLQLVANTYPESKDLNLNGLDLVTSMLGRLFPEGYDIKRHHRAPKLRQQDTCTAKSPGFPEKNADFEELQWSGSHGKRKAGDLLLLDYDCKSSGSSELSRWGEYSSVSPGRGRGNESFHYQMKEPYHISTYGRSRSPWKKYLISHLPSETFESQTLSGVDSHHSNDLHSRQNLLIGWVDEKTEDEDQLQIAPYKFDFDRSLHSNCQSLWKTHCQSGSNRESRLSSFPPQIVSGHCSDFKSYFQADEHKDDYVAPGHLLEGEENKRWDMIHSHGTGSCFTTKDNDSNFPYMKPPPLTTPDIFPKQTLVPSSYTEGQLTRVDQPWEVFGKEVPWSQYKSHDYHSYTDGAPPRGYANELSSDQLSHHRLPLTFDEESVLQRSLTDPSSASNHKCKGDMIFITGKIECIQFLPVFCAESSCSKKAWSCGH